MTEVVIGVDVSKDWLDVSRDGVRVVRVVPSGYGDLARSAAEAGALVVFEASGGYDAALREALDAAGVSYARVNPARARFYARGLGLLAKTDAVDARMLWRMGRGQALEVTPPEPQNLTELKALQARRRQLTDVRAAERTRLHQARNPAVLRSLEGMIAAISAEIAALDTAIAALIATDPALSGRAGRLISAPGVGPATAAGLLAECPELGAMDHRQVAALAGLAPVAHDSGKHRGQRRIGGGRAPLRVLLYRAALTAARVDPQFMALKARLRAAGKAPKQAIIAVARKLLTILNAMIRDNRPYTQTKP